MTARKSKSRVVRPSYPTLAKALELAHQEIDRLKNAPVACMAFLGEGFDSAIKRASDAACALQAPVLLPFNDRRILCHPNGLRDTLK